MMEIYLVDLLGGAKTNIDELKDLMESGNFEDALHSLDTAKIQLDEVRQFLNEQIGNIY
jgi:hypothetical protein